MRGLLLLLLTAAGTAAAQTPPAPAGCRPMPECLVINSPGPGDNEGGLGGLLRGGVRVPPPAAVPSPPIPPPAPVPPRPGSPPAR